MLSSTGFAGRRCVHLATLIPSWSSQCCVLQQQQQRTFGAWTKAKKKRQARWERNQGLKAANRLPPTPPYYISRDTPVQNAIDKELHRKEIEQHDAMLQW